MNQLGSVQSVRPEVSSGQVHACVEAVSWFAPYV